MKVVLSILSLLSFCSSTLAFAENAKWRSVTGSDGFFLIDNGPSDRSAKCSSAISEAHEKARDVCRGEDSYIVEQQGGSCKQFFGSQTYTVRFRCESDGRQAAGSQKNTGPLPVVKDTIFHKLNGNTYSLSVDKGGYDKCSPNLLVKILGDGQAMVRQFGAPNVDEVNTYDLNNNGRTRERYCYDWSRANRACFRNEEMRATSDYVKIVATVEHEDRSLGVLHRYDGSIRLEMYDLGAELLYKSDREHCVYRKMN